MKPGRPVEIQRQVGVADREAGVYRQGSQVLHHIMGVAPPPPAFRAFDAGQGVQHRIDIR